MPENRTRALFLKMKQVHFPRQLAVIPLFCLFQLLEIGVQFFLFGKSSGVNAAQHRLGAVTTPIGARHFHQLEGRANLAH